MNKQEKIKEAWVEIVGEANFDKLKLDDWGFSDWRCRSLFSRSKDSLVYDRLKSGSNKMTNGGDLVYRPKSLQGIENNNGWIKVESESDLPKETKDFDVLFSNDVLGRCKWNNTDKMFYSAGYNHTKQVTHYKEIVVNQRPLY